MRSHGNRLCRQTTQNVCLPVPVKASLRSGRNERVFVLVIFQNKDAMRNLTVKLFLRFTHMYVARLTVQSLASELHPLKRAFWRWWVVWKWDVYIMGFLAESGLRETHLWNRLCQIANLKCGVWICYHQMGNWFVDELTDSTMLKR